MALRIEDLNRRPYPRQIIVDIHSFCNAKCAICPYDDLKSKNEMGIMDERLFVKIIDDFRQLSKIHKFNGSVIFCNMGELFFSKDVIERIKYVLKSGLTFSIQTNAALLTHIMVDRLLASGFSGSITISCHGISPDVYRQVMGLDIGVTLKNIDYLTGRYPNNRIQIQAIPHEWPKGEARRVRNYWQQKGIAVRMPLPNNRGGLLPSIRTRYKKTLVGCRAGRPLGEMVVCFNGDVILCCNDMGQQEIVGNLAENTIEEVWNGDAFRNRIEKIYCGKASDYDFICKMCEFGQESNSQILRFMRNIRYSLKRLILTRIW
ncbi:radical SAM domain protein [delta proteobacterium NaphS2]|nr:radical SAM domain protein [delta proteobacterium NaphS2]